MTFIHGCMISGEFHKDSTDSWKWCRKCCTTRRTELFCELQMGQVIPNCSASRLSGDTWVCCESWPFLAKESQQCQVSFESLVLCAACARRDACYRESIVQMSPISSTKRWRCRHQHASGALKRPSTTEEDNGREVKVENVFKDSGHNWYSRPPSAVNDLSAKKENKKIYSWKPFVWGFSQRSNTTGCPVLS